MFALLSCSICFNSFVSDSSYHFSSKKHILFVKDLFLVDISIISSPNRSKIFSLTGIRETFCSPFLTCVAKDCVLKSFQFCALLLLNVLSLEIICIAKSI